MNDPGITVGRGLGFAVVGSAAGANFAETTNTRWVRGSRPMLRAPCAVCTLSRAPASGLGEGRADAVRLHGFNLLGRGRQRLRQGRGIAGGGLMHGHRDDGAGLQIDPVLGLVRQVRAPVFHLRDARIRVVRMLPVAGAALLRPGAIDPDQILARRRRDARRLREARQEFLVRLARVAPHNAAQRSIRFERRRIDPDRLAIDQARVGDPLQYLREDRLMRLEIDQPAGAGDHRMIRRTLVQLQPEETAHAQRIGRAPRDRALESRPSK